MRDVKRDHQDAAAPSLVIIQSLVTAAANWSPLLSQGSKQYASLISMNCEEIWSSQSDLHYQNIGRAVGWPSLQVTTAATCFEAKSDTKELDERRADDESSRGQQQGEKFGKQGVELKTRKFGKQEVTSEPFGDCAVFVLGSLYTPLQKLAKLCRDYFFINLMQICISSYKQNEVSDCLICSLQLNGRESIFMGISQFSIFFKVNSTVPCFILKIECLKLRNCSVFKAEVINVSIALIYTFGRAVAVNVISLDLIYVIL
ncbi:uncharacterized protein [Typha latifolia]|uniref:uncharacterized protein isoform X3 n=1 Tax=Typha latifolia TaxID=4733 RepID=UPI003C2E0EF1